MVCDHEDIDTVQHRLVRWRSIGEYSADIWVSCYTHPTLEGIRLATWTAVQQSVLERCSAIIYKNGAEFASMTDRYPHPYPKSEDPNKTMGEMLTEKFYNTFATDARENQLQSREDV